MEHSTEISALYNALIATQQQLQAPQKNKVAQGYKYSYKYVSLDVVLAAILTACRDHGLAVMQHPQSCRGGISLITRIIHTSGQWMQSSVVVVPVREDDNNTGIMSSSDLQQIGATITYWRRYILSSIFGLAAEEDSDGVGPVAPTPRGRRQPQQPQQPQQPTRQLQDPREYLTIQFCALQTQGKSVDDINAMWRSDTPIAALDEAGQIVIDPARTADDILHAARCYWRLNNKDKA